MATPEQLAALKRMDAARRTADRQQGLDAARDWRRQMLRHGAAKPEPRA